MKLPDLEGETIEAFRFHKVNGETFLQLTDDDIRELTARLGKRKAIKRLIRPVGWSRDGGVRERMRVELTSGGGAFPAWGMGGAL